MTLANIDTIVMVMLENRSFDHMLGYLSLDETGEKIPLDGLRSDPVWRNSHANLAGGKPYAVHRLDSTQTVTDDPPHGHASINLQINTAPAGPGPNRMGGFVQSFQDAHPDSNDPGVVMGYYDGDCLRAYDYLARHYCICDRWFSSVPLGTQANRLMAMSGESLVLDNVTGLPNQALAYDWLNERNIPWRVYVSGGYAPFFLMMRRWALSMFESLALGTGNFRRFEALQADWNSARTLPNVIFIEPEYADAPMSHPNDDHPPTPVSRGQDFVWEIYNILISNPERWKKTLMIVTYDEHGGFFDHVPPLSVQTTIGDVVLPTTGPRVPAILISPFVGPRQVFSEPLDHTSALQLLADRFAADGKYSDAVSTRQQHFGRIAHALADQQRTSVPAPRPPVHSSAGVLRTAAAHKSASAAAPQTPNALAIDSVARDLAKEHPEWLNAPGWQDMKKYLENNPQPEPVHHGRIN